MLKTLKFPVLSIVLLLILSIIFSYNDSIGKESEKTSRFFSIAKINLDDNGVSPVEIRLDQNRDITLSSFWELYRSTFPLSDENRIELFKDHTDQYGQTHNRYKQTYKDIEISAVQYLVHEIEGSAKYAHGKLIHGLNLDVIPSISEDEAFDIVLNKLGLSISDLITNQLYSVLHPENQSNKTYPGGVLQISAGPGKQVAENYRLVYRFDIYSTNPLGRYYVDVDAHSGQIVDVLTLMYDIDVAGQGLTLYDGEKPITIDSVTTDSFRLRESGRGKGILTFNMLNRNDINEAVEFSSKSPDFYDEYNQAGVSVHWAAEATYDYFWIQHGRNSYDDAGGILRSFVHYGTNFNNSVWIRNYMIFGDGDGIKLSPMVSLDIVGHEITHGVTAETANLIYQNEPGALNESFSDIFGKVIEFFIEGDKEDWVLGEDVALGLSALRSIEDPNSLNHPDTYNGQYWISAVQEPTRTNDYGGIHTNSSVKNYWFYLLSEGGNGINDLGDTYTVTGIGIDDAVKIVYRNLTTYLMPKSQFEDAKLGSINAAVDIFGENSIQLQAVYDSWTAVGVLRHSSNPTAILDNASLSFYTEAYSSSIPNPIKIRNYGSETLIIQDFQTSGQYFEVLLTEDLPIKIEKDDSISVNVIFKPISIGEIIDTLKIVTNDPRKPVQSILLKGESIIIHSAENNKIYAITGGSSNGELFILNQLSGKGEWIGTTGYTNLKCLSVKPSTGELYAIARNGESSTLIRIDSRSASSMELSEIPNFHINAMAFDNNDDLYGIGFASGSLYSINPEEGSAMLIGKTGINNILGMSINPIDRTIWATSVLNDTIYNINKSTAAHSVFGNSNLDRISGIVFDEYGKLYGLSSYYVTENSDFVGFNTLSGKGYLIGETGLDGIIDLAINYGTDSKDRVLKRYILHQNYPNPFNYSTSIRYDLSHDGHVILRIYNIEGQRIKTLADKKQSAGYKSVLWNGKNIFGHQVGSGIYIYTLNVDNQSLSKKMIYLK